MIHSNICESEKLSTISYAAETLYYRLLTRVDDNGNFTADPRTVFGQCMVLREDMNPKKISALLDELATVSGKDKKPLIEFYETNGDRYLHINKFEDFQYLRPDRFASIKHPEHPAEMGPTVVPSVNRRYTSGKPAVNLAALVNPRDTGGIPVVNQRFTLSKENEKLSEEKIEENEKLETGSDSFGQGTFKNISIQYSSYFGVGHSKSKIHKEKYYKACQKYGEDQVLSYFKRWAESNSWFKQKRDTNGLNLFWSQMEDMIEGDSVRLAREEETKKQEGPEIPEAEIEAALQAGRESKKAEADRQLEEKRKRDEFLAAHRDEI